MLKNIGEFLTSEYAIGFMVACSLFLVMSLANAVPENSFVQNIWNELTKADTIIASVFAFFAARYAYIYSIHDKLQRSLNYATALKIELVRCLAITNKTHTFFKADTPDPITAKVLLDQMFSYKKNLSKADILMLAPDVAKPIILCVDNFDIVTEQLSQYIEAIEKKDTAHQERMREFIINSTKSFATSYQKVNKFIKENEKKYLKTA